ncbi:MAG TPA: hypothetical protein PLY25_08665 [Bacteroidia bacterium]|nr:hypothetical protein [Bacteroidia bacterium]
MLPQLLWIFASVVILLLAVAHLYYTFFTNKFSIRNDEVEEGMKNSYLNLTKETTLWKAWIGFNGSHSSGIIFMALINMYLSITQYEFLRQSFFIQGLTLATSLFLLFLGKKYWFNIPYTGAVVSFACYLIAVALMLL